MFGFTRRKATAVAIEATLPLIKTLEIGGPLPDRFWSDPYVLGYLYFTIGAFAKAATNGKVVGEDMGHCLFDTFSAISQKDGLAIGRRTTELALQKDPEFLDGISNAEKVIAVTYGSRDFDHDPDVIAAVQLADAIGASMDFLGPTDRRTKIASSLGLIVFNNRVKKRLGISD